MVFSSHAFLFYFLPATLVLYYSMPRQGRHAVLTMLSYVFYGWVNPLFVILLFSSTIIDYFCGLVIAGRGPVWVARLLHRPCLAARWRQPLDAVNPVRDHSTRQRVAVVVSICTNLSLLGFFKYFNFASENLSALAAWLGVPLEPSLGTALQVTLPLGISFYTFQSMSYTLDVYRGHATALRNFVDFACYVSMFPQLVAGPIIRFSEVADQLSSRTLTVTKFARGIAFISLGLAKKVLLANPCGRISDLAFEAGSLGVVDAWYGITAYAFQIYFDFSGYTDMAIGLGLMLGFVFPKNFNSPYLSQSMTEFWQRWHISLSSWLRDYLYVPLGGNRKSDVRTYLNLGIVMLLGGLWHGAAWNFVIWGGLHGSLLSIERMRGKASMYHRLPRVGRTLATFVMVLITWVFFRSADLPSAARYLRSMFGLIEPADGAMLVSGVFYNPYYVGTFVLASVITWGAPQTWDWTRRLTTLKAGAVIGLLGLSLAVLSTQAYNPFIYFIF
jgi:alginate O-acetyltransferase complex protein AlgI